MLKRSFILLSIFIMCFGLIRGEAVYFTDTPALSPDGEKIAFSFEGDLWMVNSEGGTAYRLTGMRGNETFPRFSPDGKLLAFSASPEGNNNVYVMPVKGGEIRQLTFNDASDKVDSWSWDSQTIYFNSNRYNAVTTFKIPITGGTPERMFKHYFNRPHNIVEHPVSGDLYFTDTWESFAFAGRKRYKGDYNPDLKSYNMTSKKLTIHTTYRGKDLWPTIDKNGEIYFASDRDNGQYNLFKLENKKITRLTNFDKSIKTPNVSADGGKVVFLKEYQLMVFDTKTGKTMRPEVSVFRNDVLGIPRNFDVKDKISAFEVSPDGKKFGFVSRGRLFVSDIKGKFVRHLPTAPSERVREVTWLKDNKTILYTRTNKGKIEIFKKRADLNEKETQLTFDKMNSRSISFNSAGTQIVYLSGRRFVKILDLETSKSRVIIDDEIWGLFSSPAYFSPDDQYIVFTAYRNFEQDIMLHNLRTKKNINLTRSGTSEITPVWSSDCKYLYFVANRFTPFFPTGGNGAKVYRIPLEKYDDSYKSSRFDSLFEKPKDKEKDKKDKKETKAAKPKVTIDLDLIEERWQQVSPNPGTQYNPYVMVKKDTYTVLYNSNHDGARNNIWKTVIKPFERPKTKKIAGAVSENMAVTCNGDKYYALINGNIGTLDLAANKFKPIAINFAFSKNLQSEFRQMFFEVWAGLHENFYDEKFHGEDWEKLKEQYLVFLPHVRSRRDLRILLNDMLGELNASHMGFRSRGQEEKTGLEPKSMQPGLTFENANPYKVASIVTGSPADKKGIDIEAGDILVAVNGKNVDTKINREYYFTGPVKSNEMELTFKRAETRFSVKLHPDSGRQLKRRLYDQWIRHNRSVVDKKSNKRIAYIHMKDMVDGELRRFLIRMTTDHYNSDALILDLRNNTGGNVHDAVLNFLSQRPQTQWKYRGGKMAPQPSFAPAVKPIVLLINEQSLSDAEMTAAGFKQLKLGKVIGSETYRWLIFTTDENLVDGSYYRIPCWGCYTLDGKDIETEGVKPDVYIKNTFKDRLEGKDPQLEAAIADILKQLK
ncbi:MAG: peptidase S41 [bacterium]|nr:peptidase S41 [bacterium]